MTRPQEKTTAAIRFDRAATTGGGDMPGTPGAAGKPATEYGFFGRDHDIQAIERRVGARVSNQLLIQGVAGAGKSALLAHLAWLWQSTGLVEKTFRFSYEDRAWTAGQIVREIRSALFSPADNAKADGMPDAAQLEQLAQRLRAQRHLLILDQLDAVTQSHAGIPHTLSPAEQRQLRSLLACLRGGQTVVLLGSRGDEAWLTSVGSGPASYALRGLGPHAALLLAERVLDRHGWSPTWRIKRNAPRWRA